MTLQPLLPFGGVAGWAFLQRTRERQLELVNATGPARRDADYFRENIGHIDTPEDLVADRRLLRVALGAFGLQDDIDNRFFIRKILEGGTLDPDSLANRLSDKRYFNLAKAFGFGDFDTPNTILSDFPDRILSEFRSQEFERGIGDQNPDMRLALGAERELKSILAKDTSDDGFWFFVMGTPPLRRVFEVALGLPQSLARLDVDQQLRVFRQKSEAVFGNGEINQFSDKQKREELVRRFLVRADSNVSSSGFSPAAAAVALLSNAVSPGGLFAR
ncbi:MAG TPA: DUF1217 domain-containing protein [Rhodobacteraceae bacterium]|nr:DUF1217 domain-containing protein [Paracoccaceae bacterium]